MWETDFTIDLDVGAASNSKGGRGPLADAIHRQNCSVFERAAEKSARSMREMVAREAHLVWFDCKMMHKKAFDPQLVLEPGEHSLAKDPAGRRKSGDGRGQNPLKFEKRLFKEDD